MLFLKQNTSVKVPLGPFVDATDGGTLETAIAFASGEAQLVKHDSATIVDIGGNTFSAHLGNGFYNVTLTETDTNTLGMLSIAAKDSAARPVALTAMVMPAQVWNSLFGADLLDVNTSQFAGESASGLLTGTTALKADVTNISGSTTAADNLEASAKGIVAGVVSTGSSVTKVVTTLTEATNDHYNGRTIVFITGNLAGQAATITDYSGAAKELTVSALTEVPANTDQFVIV